MPCTSQSRPLPPACTHGEIRTYVDARGTHVRTYVRTSSISSEDATWLMGTMSTCPVSTVPLASARYTFCATLTTRCFSTLGLPRQNQQSPESGHVRCRSTCMCGQCVLCVRIYVSYGTGLTCDGLGRVALDLRAVFDKVALLVALVAHVAGGRRIG